MKTYINNGGNHSMRDGTIVKTGGTIECEEDLAKMFPAKFKEVVDGSIIDGQIPTKQKPTKTESVKSKSKAPKEKQPEGMVDVTDQFNVPEGYSVKMDKRGGWVFDGDEEPANDKPLKRNEVEAFIGELVK